jgi:signal transduction histidine kinase
VRVALTFNKITVLQQGVMGVGSLIILSLFGPIMLRINGELAEQVVARAFVIALGVILASSLATYSIIRRHRFLLRSLALGSNAVEESDVALLRSVPLQTLVVHLVVGFVAGFAFLLLRPAELSVAVAHEFVVFGWVSTLATGVPGYVLVQSRVGRLLESSPLDTVTSHLIELSTTGAPRRLSRVNLVFAVVAPVALVGVGGVLATYAHLRSIHDESRAATAFALGRGVIGAGASLRSSGQGAASRTARDAGYEVSLKEGSAPASMEREPEGTLLTTVSLPQGNAKVRFRSELGFQITFPLAVGAGLVLGLALLLSLVLARIVSRDIARATQELSSLGTEAVLRGAHAGSSARFLAIDQLLAAARQLMDRFRVFAAAQERTLEAKEVAQRTRGLLFASVSHDLKSPLNAIVGFAESIDTEPLSSAQRESLELISTRGRELVALIETILDAARVDAGQLALTTTVVDVRVWFSDASRLARRLAPATSDVRLELADVHPSVLGDPVYLSRALALILAHAMRSPTLDGAPSRVVARASFARRLSACRVEVQYDESSTLTDGELRALFEQGLAAGGRGLTLALGLSRSIIELHCGKLTVEKGLRDAPLVVILVPVP